MNAISRYPQAAGDPLAMAMLCQELRTRGQIADSFAIGLAAVEAAPENMEVRDLVRAALSAGIPDWHGPMLLDEPRNRCYAQAIARLVKPGMRVLEIGTGAGLLALLAARAGAEVVTCEANPMVAAAAREIARRNGLDDRITVISRYSNDLDASELPGKADLLMSELFDDTLFGDSIVDVIADARARLLKPGAPVLPRRSELRCALIALNEEPENPVGDVEGFDMAAFNLLAPAPPSRLRATPGNARLRSDEVPALAMDFEAESFGELEQRVRLTSKGGRVDGVAQWLHIDFGEGVTYRSDPFHGPRSHWGAPVYPFVAPVDTVPGDTLDVTFRLVSSQLLMRLES